MVPMLTCGLVRSNFAFATGFLLGMDLYALLHRRQVIFAGCQAYGALLALGLRDDLLGDVPRNLGVGVELHGVAGPAGGLAPQVADVANISDSGTRPLTTRAPLRSSMAWIWPRRELRSPMTSPM